MPRTGTGLYLEWWRDPTDDHSQEQHYVRKVCKCLPKPVKIRAEKLSSFAYNVDRQEIVVRI